MKGNNNVKRESVKKETIYICDNGMSLQNLILDRLGSDPDDMYKMELKFVMYPSHKMRPPRACCPRDTSCCTQDEHPTPVTAPAPAESANAPAPAESANATVPTEGAKASAESANAATPAEQGSPAAQPKGIPAV